METPEVSERKMDLAEKAINDVQLHILDIVDDMNDFNSIPREISMVGVMAALVYIYRSSTAIPVEAKTLQNLTTGINVIWDQYTEKVVQGGNKSLDIPTDSA